jgi:adenylate cyclase
MLDSPMNQEIERKFLVANDAWRAEVMKRLSIRQGYLASDALRSVRVRAVGEAGYLTIKARPQRGDTHGGPITRPEFEYAIPRADADALLDTLCDKPLIEKTRHLVTHGGRIWEIDEFGGANAGLIVAEIELDTADQAIVLPAWLGREVSSDPRYFNSALAKRPYSQW